MLNRDFEETCRVSAGLRSVLFMLFNPVKDELITGGVDGTKVWRYHQVADKGWREIKPMANYELTLKVSSFPTLIRENSIMDDWSSSFHCSLANPSNAKHQTNSDKYQFLNHSFDSIRV